MCKEKCVSTVAKLAAIFAAKPSCKFTYPVRFANSETLHRWEEHPLPSAGTFADAWDGFALMFVSPALLLRMEAPDLLPTCLYCEQQSVSIDLEINPAFPW